MQMSTVYEFVPNLYTSVIYGDVTNHSNEQQMGLAQRHVLHALAQPASQQIQIGFCA